MLITCAAKSCIFQNKLDFKSQQHCSIRIWFVPIILLGGLFNTLQWNHCRTTTNQKDNKYDELRSWLIYFAVLITFAFFAFSSSSLDSSSLDSSSLDEGLISTQTAHVNQMFTGQQWIIAHARTHGRQITNAMQRNKVRESRMRPTETLSIILTAKITICD